MAPKRPKTEGTDPGATGSIDVQFSGTALPKPAPEEIPPEVTGSLDVQFSSTAIPKPLDPATSGSVDVSFSQPIPVARATPPRRRRATTVPGIIAESITNLPVIKDVMPKTRKGRVLVRSVIVAFGLIGLWIGVILWIQLRGEEKPDLRPQVEAIFDDLRDGKIDDVFEHSSNRFQELTLAENFEHSVLEQNEVLGPFVEVAAVIRTEMFRGPSGKTARADLLLDFENGRCSGNMSFIYEDGQWRMLGFRVDIPDDLAAAATSQESRAKRVKAPQAVIETAIHVLELSSQGKSDEIWEAAAPVFQQSKPKQEFEELEDKRRAVLGPFRFLHVTQAHQTPSGGGANVEGIATYGDTSLTQAVSLKFTRLDGEWKLSFYKVILPMPHGPSTTTE